VLTLCLRRCFILLLLLCAVLTALTCLQLDDLGAAVDDAAAAALARSLTGLRHLELQGSDIEQQATVAALQALPVLTHLQLCTEEEEEAAGAGGDAGTPQNLVPFFTRL
jgi:hypothetical protein